MKKRIKLTESDIQNIVERSVKRILNERETPMVDYLAEMLTNCDAKRARAIARDIYEEFDMMDSYGIDDIIRKYNPNCPPQEDDGWSYCDNF